MKTPMPRGKRIFLVNRDFQLRYTRVALAVGVVSTALTVFLILYPLFYLDIVRFPTFLPRPFLIGIVFAAIVNLAIVAFMGILMTHRIAGPMFALVRQMRAIQAGYWQSHLKVRPGDDMKYVVRNFNDLVDYMLDTSKRDLTHVDLALAKLRSLDTGGALTELQQLHEELSARFQGDLPSEGTKKPSETAHQPGMV
jgi:hypothetical protein